MSDLDRILFAGNAITSNGEIYIRADLVAKWTAGIPQAALEVGIVAEMIEFIKIVSLDEKWDKSGSNWGPWIPTRNAISARAVLSKLTSGEG